MPQIFVTSVGADESSLLRTSPTNAFNFNLADAFTGQSSAGVAQAFTPFKSMPQQGIEDGGGQEPPPDVKAPDLQVDPQEVADRVELAKLRRQLPRGIVDDGRRDPFEVLGNVIFSLTNREKMNRYQELTDKINALDIARGLKKEKMGEVSAEYRLKGEAVSSAYDEPVRRQNWKAGQVANQRGDYRFGQEVQRDQFGQLERQRQISDWTRLDASRTSSINAMLDSLGNFTGQQPTHAFDALQDSDLQDAIDNMIPEDQAAKFGAGLPGGGILGPILGKAAGAYNDIRRKTAGNRAARMETELSGEIAADAKSTTEAIRALGPNGDPAVARFLYSEFEKRAASKMNYADRRSTQIISERHRMRSEQMAERRQNASERNADRRLQVQIDSATATQERWEKNQARMEQMAKTQAGRFAMSKKIQELDLLDRDLQSDISSIESKWKGVGNSKDFGKGMIMNSSGQVNARKQWEEKTAALQQIRDQRRKLIDSMAGAGMQPGEGATSNADGSVTIRIGGMSHTVTRQEIQQFVAQNPGASREDIIKHFALATTFLGRTDDYANQP